MQKILYARLPGVVHPAPVPHPAELEAVDLKVLDQNTPLSLHENLLMSGS